MALTHKPGTQSANPLGSYPEFPELDEKEKAIPELVTFHKKMEDWYYDLRRVLLREREEIES